MATARTYRGANPRRWNGALTKHAALEGSRCAPRPTRIDSIALDLGARRREERTCSARSGKSDDVGRDVTRWCSGWHREAVDVGEVPIDLEEAYRKYSDELIRFATGLVGPSDASDVVSNAIASCLGSQSWASVRDPRSYMFRVDRKSVV